MTTTKHIILIATSGEGATPTVTPSSSPPSPLNSPTSRLPDLHLEVLFQYGWLGFLLLLTAINKKYFKPWLNRGRGFIKRDARMDSEINSILHQMLGIADVDRVVLGVFHNARFNEEKANDLMSVSNEAIRLGISSVRNQVRDIPMSSLAKEIVKLKGLPPGHFLFVNIADPTLEDSCRAHMLSIGVRYTASMLLLDSKKDLGIISIQVCARIPTLEEIKNFREKNEMFDSQTMSKLSALADLLSYTLSRTRPNMFDAMWDVIVTND